MFALHVLKFSIVPVVIFLMNKLQEETTTFKF